MKEIWYCDSGLRSNLGHHAQTARVLIPALEKLGCAVHVAAVQNVDQDVAEEFQAGRVFRRWCYTRMNPDQIAGWMSDFMVTGQETYEDLASIARDGSLIYWNSAQTGQLHGLMIYLHQHPNSRAVVEFGTGVGLEMHPVPNSTDKQMVYPDPRVNATATLYRYCSYLLNDFIRSRITMVTFDQRASELYSAVLDAPVDTFPIPRNVHPNPFLRGQKPQLTISFLGHQRIGDKGYQFVPAIVRQVLEQAKFMDRPVKFLIHNGDANSPNPAMQDLQKQVRHLTVEYPNLVEVDERLANDVIWQELLDKSDLIVCPYWPERFYSSYSAVACEAVANGIPLVVPANTSLSNFTTFLGQQFVTWESFYISATVLGSVRMFDDLVEESLKQVRAWAYQHGADRTSKAIMENLS